MDARSAKEIMVYAIGPRERVLQRPRTCSASQPDRGCKKLSEETGGGFFLLKKKDELGPTFTRVAQELHSQYVLGFSPTALDGKVHKLEVKIKKPGMTRERVRVTWPRAGTTAGERK